MSQEFVKLLLIGDSGVGKSCLLTRFCEDKFVNAYYNTIGVDFKTKKMMINNTKCKLQIWDTAGQQRFRTITANYYKGAHGILLVFDLTSQESLKNIQFWLSQVQKHANSTAKLILVGNKCDIEEKRQISEDAAMNYANKHNLQYIEASAFNAANVNLVFQTAAKNILQSKTQIGNSSKTQISNSSLNQPIGGTSIKKQKPGNKKQSCC